MTTLHDAQLLMRLFEGSDLAFGRSDPTDKITQKGKHETRSWTEKRPVTEEDWRRHIEGVAGIGIPPINSESQVRFGAIDVDQYTGLSLEDLAIDIRDTGLPILLCRSKSGGPHLYLFVNDWVPASLMVEKLEMVASFFGFGASEIFPKQVSIGQHSSHPDFGNWINMPYFNGINNFRYALRPDGTAIETIREFAEYAASKTLSPEELAALEPPREAEDDKLFPDGPPCLNAYFSRKREEGSRNIVLCNIAVYAKKAFPDEWKDRLEEYNNKLFESPLPNREVEAIKRSYQAKDYRYQCSKSPMCDFCNSKLCKGREHGIEEEELMPNNRSLTVINTSPPIWYLDVETNSGETRRISLATDELQNPRLFQKRCMESLKTMPPIPKSTEWTTVVQNLMKYVTEINVPKELSPAGQLLEMVESFIVDKGSSDSPEDVMRGLVFCGPETYTFRYKDLKDYLARNRFDLLKQNEITAVLQNECKMSSTIPRIGGKSIRLQEIDRKNFQVTEPEPLKEKKIEEPF